MRKILISILCIFIGFSTYATGENIPTSKSYVDSAVAQKQDKIPANNGAEQILMNTGTPGSVGTKNIYDSTGSYAEQTDALITAEQFNTAVQNAIDSEFECVGWDPTHTHCWFVKILGVPDQSLLPTGYTQLEYLESTGTQYINTKVASTNNIGVAIKYAFMKFGTYKDIFGTFDPHYYLGINSFGTDMLASYGPTAGNTVLGIPIGDVVIGQPYTLNINLYNSGTVEFVGIRHAKLAPKTFASDRTFYMFGTNTAYNSGYLSQSRIYYMKMTDGTRLVRDFVPARRDRDGELGMYDLVSNTFFTNDGGGKFIAGPVVYLPQGN